MNMNTNMDYDERFSNELAVMWAGVLKITCLCEVSTMCVQTSRKWYLHPNALLEPIMLHPFTPLTVKCYPVYNQLLVSTHY
jgi:hypothetical protein